MEGREQLADGARLAVQRRSSRSGEGSRATTPESTAAASPLTKPSAGLGTGMPNGAKRSPRRLLYGGFSGSFGRMHPIERLRYVARATGADPSLLVRETAAALADVMRVEPVGLVPACRRLIDRHLTVAPVWWLCARLSHRRRPHRRGVGRGRRDGGGSDRRHPRRLPPEEATVTLVGWPDVAAGALRRRGDLELLIADAQGDGSALVRRLIDCDVDAVGRSRRRGGRGRGRLRSGLDRGGGGRTDGRAGCHRVATPPPPWPCSPARRCGRSPGWAGSCPGRCGTPSCTASTPAPPSRGTDAVELVPAGAHHRAGGTGRPGGRRRRVWPWPAARWPPNCCATPANGDERQ